MPWRFFLPGERKGNKAIVARGSIAGKEYEFTTHTTNPKAARQFARDFEAKVKADIPNPDNITWEEAARRYIAFRKPSPVDQLRIERLYLLLGKKRIRDLRQADIHDAALRQYPKHTAATRNREVLRPVVTVLHHAAGDGLCTWLKVKSFPEPPRKPRAVDAETAAAVIETVDEGPKRKLLVWLFYQGTRISETLRVDWAHIHLDRGRYDMFNTKGRRHKERALHASTIAELKLIPEEQRTGPVFPWRTKSGVYKWLRPLMRKHDLPFTPHVARHTLGTLLNAQGASLRTIMDALDHSQASSSLIYQKGDVEIVRAAIDQLQLSPRAETSGKVA